MPRKFSEAEIRWRLSRLTVHQLSLWLLDGTARTAGISLSKAEQAPMEGTEPPGAIRECCGSFSHRHKAGCRNGERADAVPAEMDYECDGCGASFRATRRKKRTCPSCGGKDTWAKG